MQKLAAAWTSSNSVWHRRNNIIQTNREITEVMQMADRDLFFCHLLFGRRWERVIISRWEVEGIN